MGHPDEATPVVPVGTLGRAHGVGGGIRVRSDMEPADELLRHETWLVERDGGWRPMAVRSARPHGGVFVAWLEGVEDRDAAAGLAGARLGLPRAAFPRLDDGQYYWVDLIGLEVVDGAGTSLGFVREMIETGANDVMVIGSPGPEPSRDRVVPFLIGEVVEEVDLQAGRIRVSWWDDER